ncbi:MAG TPA: family 43 glycosylhydrolase [Bryobacteraceae bacterium]|nr:family 43 glycosylhydrolase [Bryobacteraceae bacterium]
MPASRRQFLTAAACLAAPLPRAWGAPVPPELRTPHKANRLVVKASGTPGAFDQKSVDSPFVYSHDGRYYMCYIGFDGTGYQTGLASSANLLDWKPEGLLIGRDPSSELFRYNVALSWIVRENDLFSSGRLKKIQGRYLGVYHAYPAAGYEQGAAVIGLAWSSDLRKWQLEQPCLRAADGAAWERGGLYKPCLVEHQGTFYLFYNAKTEASRWHEQTGVATSRDLKTWTRHAANPLIPNGPAGSPDELFASDPCVLSFGKQWAFFYFGLDGRGVARDLVAAGPDLLHPAKCEGVLIDVGAAGSVDERFAHKPSMICRDGVLYHFYCAVSKQDVRGISVAASRSIG